MYDFPIHIIPCGYMHLMSKPLPGQDSSILEGEYMNEYRDEGINDVCGITMDTTAHLLALDRKIRHCSPSDYPSSVDENHCNSKYS